MSFDDELEQNDQEATAGDGGADGDGGYGDGGGDEAGVDSAFVVAGEKQPLSKGTVAMFVILAIAGAGTYGMYVKSGTQSAAAAADPKATAVIKEFMTQRDKNAQAMKKMLTDTDAVVRQFTNYRVQQIPLSGLVANPFRTAPANPAEGSSRLDEEAAKKKREEERVAILKAVNGLQLQSVMHSDSRKSCMINNALYTEGQQVDAFLIEKIAPNCVIVRNGQYRFELRMQR
jgi:hypothetical protein